MKLRLHEAMKVNVPPALFVLACLLLATVSFCAKTMVDNISFASDQLAEQLHQPTPDHHKAL